MAQRVVHITKPDAKDPTTMIATGAVDIIEVPDPPADPAAEDPVTALTQLLVSKGALTLADLQAAPSLVVQADAIAAATA